MSEEINNFRDVINGFLANIADDINRLLGRNPGLSDEDKATLVDLSKKAAEIANIVPEDSPPTDEAPPELS